MSISYGIFKKADNSILTIHAGEDEANKLNTICFSDIETEVKEIYPDSEEYMTIRDQFLETHGFEMKCYWWEIDKVDVVPAPYAVDNEGNDLFLEDGSQLINKRNQTKTIQKERYPGYFDKFLQRSLINNKMIEAGPAWQSLYVNKDVNISVEDWIKLGS
tara:strand:- start:22 stop:501 length:480 start_codon:yes stop_codon:yes gene_type:complete